MLSFRAQLINITVEVGDLTLETWSLFDIAMFWWVFVLLQRAEPMVLLELD